MLEGAAALFLAEYLGAKALDALLKKVGGDEVVRDIHRAIEAWRTTLPERLQFATSATLFPSVPQGVDQSNRPALSELRSSLSSNQIPSSDCWFNALLEQWKIVSAQPGELQDFFSASISDVTPQLRELSSKLERVCATHDALYKPTVYTMVKELHQAGLGSATENIAARTRPVIAYPKDAANERVAAKLEEMRKFRLVPEYNAVEQAGQLTTEILEGNYLLADELIKSSALGFCIRILAVGSTRTKAAEILGQTNELPPTNELDVARALLVDEYGSVEVHCALSSLSSADARSAAFVHKLNSSTAEDAVQWLADTEIGFEGIDAHAKCVLMNAYFHDSKWSEADTVGQTFCECDFTETPVSLVHRATALWISTAPEHDRSVLLYGLPLEPELVSLSDAPDDCRRREEAIKLFERAQVEFRNHDLTENAIQMQLWSIWLRLRTPALSEAARSELALLVRQPEEGIRYVNLALRFGANLSRDEAEKILRRNIALKGSLGADAAIAQLSIILMHEDDIGRANEFSARLPELLRHLNPKMLDLIQVQVLCRAGRTNEAKAVSDCYNDDTELQRRMLRMIAEAQGVDPSQARLDAFESSGSLPDLELLVEALEEQEDWTRSASFALELFNRTRTIRNARRYIAVLDGSGQYARLGEFFDDNFELVASDSSAAYRCAHSLYNRGKLREAQGLISQMRTRHDTDGLRQLHLACLIESGMWAELDEFAQEQYQNRANRTPAELMRVAHAVLQSSPALAKRIVFHAAGSADSDPSILSTAYFVASSAGWDNDDHVGEWLTKAAELSGPDGPIQSMDLKELVDRQPAWNSHQEDVFRGLQIAQMPIEVAARALRRSISSLTTSNATRNRSIVDVRRRAGVPAFHGSSRKSSLVELQSVLVDVTVLLTLSDIGLIREGLELFQQIAIVRGTCGVLFENLRGAKFHQPSQVEKADDLIRLTGTGVLQTVWDSPKLEPWLVEEVGVRFAKLLQTAQDQRGRSEEACFVVHPGAVTKATSLGEERAELREFQSLVLPCSALIDHLRNSGHLTNAEFEAASNNLRLRGDGRAEAGEAISIEGARLYLDELAVQYIVDLDLVGKLVNSGVKLSILSEQLADAKALSDYDSCASSVVSTIEAVRSFVSDSLSVGRLQIVGTEDHVNDNEEGYMLAIAALKQLNRFDAYACDDRSINRHLTATENDGASKPVISSLYILDELHSKGLITTDSWFNARHKLRTGCYLFVPIKAQELLLALAGSKIRDDAVSETAELKAIREYVAFVGSTEWIQPEAEGMWITDLHSAICKAIGSLWSGDASTEWASAASSWLVDLFDIRDWVRSKQFTAAEYSNLRASQLFVLSSLPPNLEERRQEEFLNWCDKKLIEPTKSQDPEVYQAYLTTVKQVHNDLLVTMTT